MARWDYQGTFTDSQGNVVTGGTVSVFLAGTTSPASIYGAATGGSIVNSVLSGAQGAFIFYVDDTIYNITQLFDVVLSYPNYTSRTLYNVRIIPINTPFLAEHNTDGTDKVSHFGKVHMYRLTDSDNTGAGSTWKIITPPNGAVLDTTGTTTQGLQEAINYSCRYGYDLEVNGGTVKPQQWGVANGGALGTNPFATTISSAVVTVTHTAHGFTTGYKISFNGLSGAVNGIPAANFLTEMSLTVVNANSYTVTLATVATSTGSGGGTTVRYQQAGQNPSIINCSTGITIPPVQMWKFRIGSATINITASATNIGWSWDSCMNVDFEFAGGQIVCASSLLTGMLFQPTNELPQDYNGPVITASRFKVPSIVMTNTSSTCAKLDTSSATIGSNEFTFLEPNGGGTGVAVIGNTGFLNNTLNIKQCHSQTSICVGLGNVSSTSIFGNFINLDCSPATGGVGIDIWGINNIIHTTIDNTVGTPAVGVKLESSADKNIIIVGRINGTLTIQDVSTNRSNMVFNGNQFADVNLNGTNQTGIATTTWTKVNFNNKVKDSFGSYDAVTNYRFTPGRPGRVAIQANVGWVNAAAGVLHAIAIYKNGAILYGEYTDFGAGGGSRGLAISREVMSDNTTDYFEIFVRQDSGIAKDIIGANDTTNASYRVIG